MTDEKYRYFEAAGRSLEICQQVMAEREAGLDSLKALLAEVGADNANGSPRIVGLTFPEGQIPEGWRSYVRGYSKVVMPEKRNKALAPMRKRIEDIRIPGGFEIHRRLGFDICITGETGAHGASIIRYAVYERIGDRVVIKSPIDHAGECGTPPDAIPLKTSEYWRLKEAAGEAAAA